MKTNRSLRLVKFAMLVLVTACFGAGLANAQEVKGKFNLPFETHWGNAVLAPGDYTFRLNFSASGGDYTVLVREEDQTATMIMASTRDHSFSGKSGLIVERHGNRGTVRSLRLAEAGLVIYYPAAKAQPEVLAQGPVLIQRIPILMASK
jgi:hypothetical protein